MGGFRVGNEDLNKNLSLRHHRPVPMKLISNKPLREFAALHPDADAPLQAWRRLIERGDYDSFSAPPATFATVDKVGPRLVFNIGGNKYRLVAANAFQPRIVWVKAVLTHSEYDKGAWR
jgi:mRNA interferase HigB